ncbi:hypothetical protein AKL21_12125 [Enterococcus canintestini]|uniref:Uncharacterized protein n=1 Tax=Enterococcus canintestini TaxID=317010 RepID=A0A267HNZ6_9ENTE|nr:hypothetical protein AKL21_12125 [Enterococcus canintestini]
MLLDKTKIYIKGIINRETKIGKVILIKIVDSNGRILPSKINTSKQIPVSTEIAVLKNRLFSFSYFKLSPLVRLFVGIHTFQYSDDTTF